MKQVGGPVMLAGRQELVNEDGLMPREQPSCWPIEVD